ncbi:flippase [Sphingobacteriales bacterium UPWRP_1]|nr:hypothetical protein B6N25_08740 [Sphingobacteriales bacterium TSM_CSS]PSJ77376.1 flippase [Sphingobacteriales bacterium UPWRP_1]
MSGLQQSSYWYKSAIYTLFEQFSVVLFGFGSVFLLLRVLSKEEFGIWALFLTVAAFIEVGRNGLIQNALIKHLTALNPHDAGYSRQYAVIGTASLVVNILLTAVSIALLYFFAGYMATLWRSPQLQNMFYIYAISTTALIPFSQCTFLQQANFNFRGVFWANFARQGVFFLLVLFAWFNGSASLTGIAVYHALAATAGAVVAFAFARKYLRLSANINRQWMLQLLHYGKYVFGTNLGAMLHKSIDKFMLGSMLGTGAVALYDLAIRINNLMEIPVAATASVVFPQSARNSNAGSLEAVKILYEKSVAAVLAVLLPAIALVLLYPKTIIVLIAGAKYADTAPLLQITVLYGLFMPFARQFGTIFDSIGKPRLNFLFVVLGALLNLVFNYFFIRRFGTIGAAYGTLLVFAITFVLNQIILYRQLNVRLLSIAHYVLQFYRQLLGKIDQSIAELTSAKTITVSQTAKPESNEKTV